MRVRGGSDIEIEKLSENDIVGWRKMELLFEYARFRKHVSGVFLEADNLI